MTDTVRVDIKSAWLSKVNWTQVVGVGATALALVTGNKYQVPADVQVNIVVAIQAAQAVATWVIKTWFTPTVTAASMPAPVSK